MGSAVSLPNMSLRVLELAAATDFGSVSGPISSGGPIAGAPEAVGGAGVPCAVRVVRGIRRGGCVRHCHELVCRCSGVSSAVGATPLAGTAAIVVCVGANTKVTKQDSGAMSWSPAASRRAPLGTASTDVCAGANTNGSGCSQVIVAVGIEASTPVGTASTDVCAGANTNIYIPLIRAGPFAFFPIRACEEQPKH